MDDAVRTRLAARQIQVAAETASHYMLVRDNCVALVERTPTGTGSLGSTGLMTARGLAYLVRRDGSPLLAAKGSEVAADPAELAAIQAFSADLASIFAGPVTLQ